jgi:hypothetical protein
MNDEAVDLLIVSALSLESSQIILAISAAELRVDFGNLNAKDAAPPPCNV